MIAALARWSYGWFGRLVSLAWRSGWFKPGGNDWHEERMGWHPTRADQPLWLHAASLGEVAVARAYAERLVDLAPLYLTVQTDSGYRAARKDRQLWTVGYAPLDTLPAVNRFISRVHPRGLVLFETELWPVWLSTFQGPIWMANARLSSKSLKRLSRFGRILRVAWGNIQFVGAQSEGDRRRFELLGVASHKIEITGQIKQFLAVPGVDEAARKSARERLHMPLSDALWIAGSVRPDEIEIILDLFTDARASGVHSRLVLAPRHLKFVSDAYALTRQRQLSAGLVSRLNSSAQDVDVYILDTHGDLAALYAAADLALIGGTFAPYGGHNPNEPARYGVPVVTGPYTTNIEGDLSALSDAGMGFRMESLQDFSVLSKMLIDFDRRAACERLAALLDRRTHPADRLKADIADRLASYATL